MTGITIQSRGQSVRYYYTGFFVLFVTHCLAALYSPIQDCDEVFNYWEPTHYLIHGYGLQTWEYSPEYTIRSWLYIILHVVLAKPSSFFTSRKIVEFYFMRFVLAFICTACEMRLYSAIYQKGSAGRRIALLFIPIVAFSPGTFHASTAFLPSSFAMYASMVGIAAFLSPSSNGKTAEGIMWFGLGSILGWPFAGILIVPLLVKEVIDSFVSGNPRATLNSVRDGVIRCLLILGVEIAVDSIFFRKFSIVPWNIVAYNIFGGENRGPNIFGTEPWTFYIRNLLLNFNLWFVLAILTAPLLIIWAVFQPQPTAARSPLRSIAFVLPFYLWLWIFTLQPHKEERFMYPAYPFLALNAAIALDIILLYIGSSNPRRLIGRIPAGFRFAAVLAFVLFCIHVGLLRTVGLFTAYNAPLNVYGSLEEQGFGRAGDFVCFGKEWYRFPSSFFLPNNMRAKFVRSEFRGLLPGEFTDAQNAQMILENTSRVPSGMNDRNQEDPGKYVDISECSFLVDSYFPYVPSSKLEPPYMLDQKNWDKVSCSRFLDTARTSTLGRIFWIPDLPLIPERYRRNWGQYCLLRRRGSDRPDNLILNRASDEERDQGMMP